MKLSQAFPSKYLKADELEPKKYYTYTIAGSAIERMGQGDQAADRLVLYFEEEDSKPLVVNKVNANTIAMCLESDDTDDWVGQTITIYRTKTTMAGKTVDCIRVDDRPPQPEPPKKAAAAPAQRGKVATNVQRPSRSAPVDEEEYRDPF